MHKMLQVRPPTVIKTIDDQGTSYLLDGVGKRQGKGLVDLGCKWIPGHKGPGAWELSETMAQRFIDHGVEYIERDLRTEKG